MILTGGSIAIGCATSLREKRFSLTDDCLSLSTSGVEVFESEGEESVHL